MRAAARLVRNPISWAVALVVLVLLCASVFTVVPETAQALVVRAGVPDRTANRFRAGAAPGGDGAGLLAHWPLVEQVFLVDKRPRTVAVERAPVASADGTRLEIDAFARVQVTDPLRMVLATHGDSKRLSGALRPALASALQAAASRRPLAALLTPGTGDLLAPAQAALARVARQYGAVLVDVRVEHVALPEGAPLDGALDRMRAARQAQATAIRADGLRQAAAIRAQADADASRTYADAFNQDPGFYDFYRSMQSYRTAFAADNPTDGTTTFVLSPRSEYFRNFAGPPAGDRAPFNAR